MHAKPEFRPLEYDYRSHRPVWTLLKLAGRTPWFYAAVLAVLVVKHSPVWAVPFLVARLIDVLGRPEAVSVRELLLYFAAVFVLIVQNVPMQTLMVSMLSRASRDLERTLRNALVSRLQHLSIAFHDRTETGRLQAKVLRDVEQVQSFAMMVFEGGALALVSILFAAVVTAVRQPRLLFFFLLMVPIVAALRTLFHRRIHERNRAFRSEVERMSADVSEMINMIPVVRAHGLEEEEFRRMRNQFGEVNRSGRRLDVLNALFGACAFTTFQLAMLLTLGVQTFFCLRGWITVGDVVLYQSLFGMIVMGVAQLLGIYPQLARGVESIRSIGEVLECPDIERNHGKRIVDSIGGGVRFEAVGFRYAPEDEHAIRDFSLDVAPGECIALVGPSGAGKSTFMQLLIGFRRPQEGRILFDGLDMEDLDMRSVRRHLSVVPQETILFSGSIRDNVAYGMPEVPDAKVRDVLEAANLAEFVDSLPKGWDTRIGEDGAMLSGGQRQRIAIARALVRDPRLLLLDEATSALDVVSEKKVQDALDRAVRNRTTFVVAHRLSTIRNAHRIVVLRNGRIEQVGAYAELMERPGLFRDMIRLQSAPPGQN